jgi:hypothetical protein
MKEVGCMGPQGRHGAETHEGKAFIVASPWIREALEVLSCPDLPRAWSTSAVLSLGSGSPCATAYLPPPPLAPTTQDRSPDTQSALDLQAHHACVPCQSGAHLLRSLLKMPLPSAAPRRPPSSCLAR